MHNPEFEALRSTADEMDAPRTVIRKYSEEEMTDMREFATNTMMELFQHQEEAKALKEQVQKPLQSKLKMVFGKLRAGYIEEKMTLQGVKNYETGMMEYYNEDAEKVDERKLTKTEREDLKFPRQGRGTRGEVTHGFDERSGGMGQGD